MWENKSTTRLFVGWLPYNLRWQDLKDIFGEYGNVVYAKIIIDRENRKSKWFWFVEFENAQDAQKAQQELNWAEINGRTIKVDFAIEKTQQTA